MGGALYGTVGGFFLCMAGVLTGSVIIFLLSRALGYEVVENLLSRKRLSRLQFLQKEGRLEAVVFFLFFIPGTPKDALTYFAPFTRMNMGTFWCCQVWRASRRCCPPRWWAAIWHRGILCCPF